MQRWRIESKGGEDYGTWPGETPAEALLALHRKASHGPDRVDYDPTGDGSLSFLDAETRELCGDVEDWIVTAVMVHPLGDGQRICEEHWPREFPDTAAPTYGWEPGDCDWCRRSEAAQALGRRGGSSTSEAKRRAVRENGKKGGRPQSQ